MSKSIFYINKEGRNLFLFFSYNRFKDDKVLIPIEFKKFYTKMPLTYTNCDNEKIYSDLNQDSNPLGIEEYQNFIRDNQVGHTSMSVGDLIYDEIEKKYYVCMSLGFKELIWIDKKNDFIESRGDD